jgi:micrococcal nuclease
VRFAFVVLSVLAAVAAFAVAPASDAPSDPRTATVVRVVDGDTVVLSGGIGKSRLIGVDTPEVYGGVECYGREASAFAKRLLTGARVRVRRQAEPTDRYGRALVDLWLPDGRHVNALLVERGYATPLTIRPNVRYARRLARLARAARTARRGLWGAGRCPD